MASTGPRTPYVERMKRAGASVSIAPAYTSTAVAAISVARRPEGRDAMRLAAKPSARGAPGPRLLADALALQRRLRRYDRKRSAGRRGRAKGGADVAASQSTRASAICASAAAMSSC